MQDGKATAKFNATAAGPVSVVVTDGGGNQLATATVNAAEGSNTWTWDGRDGAGNPVADGSYQVNVVRTDAAGNTASLPTTIVGTVTGIQSTGTSVTVNMGKLAVDFSKLRSMQS